jgi:lysozyme
VVTSLEGETVRVLREDETAPAPLPPEERTSPVTAAAEAVAARLATVFKDEADPAAPDVQPAAEAEPAVAPASEPEPQPATEEAAPEPFAEAPPSDVEPAGATPIAVEALHGQTPDAEPLAEPFELVPPPADEATAAPEAPEEPGVRTDEEPVAEADLFAPPAPANDAAEREDTPAESTPAERVVIDDLAPFEFAPTPVQPLRKPKDGYLSLVSLAVLGLAFFAGGLFWAVNARAVGGEPLWMTPKAVGALACVAGVGFFSIALFLLLQRLGQAAERGDPEPRS